MASPYSMVAHHAHGKKVEDAIFTAGFAARDAEARLGSEHVINGTVGLILDDQEQMAVLPTVLAIIRGLPAEDFASYSPFLGSPSYRVAVEHFVFGSHHPEAFVEVAATPGSTGALRNIFWNYLDMGDAVLVADWRWSPYDTIATEHLREIEVFTLFDDQRQLTFSHLSAKLDQVFARQNRAVVVINDPCQNPTGYDMTLDEWRQLMDLFRAKIAGGSRRLVVFMDAPYLDFTIQGPQVRRIFENLGPLPRNLLFTIGYSISKSLTQYGLRTGACVAVSEDRDVLREFLEVSGASARGVWTNVSRAGMAACSRLYENSELLAKATAERELLRLLIQRRASCLMTEATAAALDLMPYRSGFFVCVPCPEPARVAMALAEKRVFVVPMAGGIRIAVSGIATHKIPGLAQTIKTTLDAVSNSTLPSIRHER